MQEHNLYSQLLQVCNYKSDKSLMEKLVDGEIFAESQYADVG